MARSVAELTESPPEPDAAPPRGRRRLVLAVAGAVLLAGVGAFLLLGGDDAEAPAEEGAIVEVAQMTANLAGSGLHYVRFGFAAVLTEGVAPADVEGRFALLKDAALTEAGTLSVEQLRSPEGIEELRNRLTARAAGVYPDGEVLRIVLTELVVQ